MTFITMPSSSSNTLLSSLPWSFMLYSWGNPLFPSLLSLFPSLVDTDFSLPPLYRAISPNVQAALGMSAIVFTIMMLFNGFFLLETSIPPWFVPFSFSSCFATPLILILILILIVILIVLFSFQVDLGKLGFRVEVCSDCGSYQ